jgi:hypothetical protein
VTAESLSWLAPAPLWGEGGVAVDGPGLLQPFLAEIKNDQFVTEFLGILGAQGGAVPTDLAAMVPVTSDGTATGPYRLFQPISQCYYLVTASLVCRRVGIPDRAVQPAKGEETSFVVRKLGTDGSEAAWIPATGPAAVPGNPPSGQWTTTTMPCRLVAGEEQLPMHGAPVAAFAAAGTVGAAFGMSESGRRTVYYGYIPTSRRDRMVTALSDADAVTTLQQVDPTGLSSPILSSLWTRVISPWGLLMGQLPATPAPPPGPPPGGNNYYPSLYILLDLADWLQTNLPAVYQAMTGGPALPAGSAAAQLLQALTDVTVATTAPGSPQAFTSVSAALSGLTTFAPLVTGTVMKGPTTSYDLVSTQLSANWVNWFLGTQTGPPAHPPASWQDPLLPASTKPSLAYLVMAALTEKPVPVTVPSELTGMIKIDPPQSSPSYAPDTYIIRTVFEHDPCQPVLSQPSRPFQLARALDGDAPARKIRIALPDPSNLRQFQRGVAIEMPPGLRRMLDRVTPAMLQGKGLGQDPGLEFGMICSFSIQIMWVLSFMVMFLFALSFNIVFWWMAFIRICFPVPVPASQPENPSP